MWALNPRSISYRRVGTRGLLVLLLASQCSEASADGILQGWSPTAKGSIRTVGSGGALTTVGSDISAIAENPANAAMSANYVTVQVGAQFTKDLQASGEDNSYVRQPYAGLILPLEHWTFGAVLSSAGSGQISAGSDFVRYLVREARLVAAWREPRLNRLSLGASLVLPSRTFSISSSELTAESATGVSFDLGAVVRLPKRIFVGTSYHRGYEITAAQSARQIRSLLTPMHEGRLGAPDRFEVGLGWMANRFLQMGSSLSWIRPDSRFRNLDGALTRLSQQAGYRWSLGIDLQWLETDHLFSRFTLGSYLEPAGTVDASSAFRIHGTAALELEYGIALVSGALDYATGYRSYVVSFGIELGRLAQRLKVVPPSLLPDPEGVLPRSTFVPNDDWLPTHLQDDPATALQTISPTFESFRNYVPRAIEKLPEQLERIENQLNPGAHRP